MSNFVEYKNKIAFHPGYYIKEIVVESGLTQEDYAKRLDTTPKNLSVLINGEQSLSIDMAVKLARLNTTSVNYWLNIQRRYDELLAEFKSDDELEKEKSIFKEIDYAYFRDHFGLPDIPRNTIQQIIEVRNYLHVSTLSILKKKDMTVSFRSASKNLSESNIIKANIMVQIAINNALKEKENTPGYNRTEFEKAAEYALTLTKNHNSFYPLLKKAFRKAGVILIVLPNMSGSKTNGATKKIGNQIVLMVNDRRKYADTFWFTLFHEVGHILNGDYGISFEQEKGQKEYTADEYAKGKLIPQDQYDAFIKDNKNHFTVSKVKRFADQIDRDPGIVVGRLQNDRYVRQDDSLLSLVKKKYTFDM